jgi:uncharacterized repeat protein (TIGR03806 family)
VPYLVASPLWSDGLLKYRYLVVPPGELIGIDDEGRWLFPAGSVLIKTFTLESRPGDPSSRRPIETRFMVRRDGVWDFYAYQWREDGSDADLWLDGAETELTIEHSSEAEAGGEIETFQWEFPSQLGCRLCHGFGDGEPLGPNNLQMNRRVKYGDEEREQLDALADIGLFQAPPPDPVSLARMPDPAVPSDPNDPSADLEARSRAYLHANCAHCHQPAWMRPDLRWTTAFADTQTCDTLVEFPSPQVGGSLRIAPGAPEESNLWLRMATRGEGRMPVLGTGRVDAEGLALIGSWIAGLEGCP